MVGGGGMTNNRGFLAKIYSSVRKIVFKSHLALKIFADSPTLETVMTSLIRKRAELGVFYMSDFFYMVPAFI